MIREAHWLIAAIIALAVVLSILDAMGALRW